jgi:23S rRNA pseudouridine1911/1915/1917 synthase
MTVALSSLPVSILYADHELVIVDKPAGQVVHPTYKNSGGTLLDSLRQDLPDPPSIVGRLDKWTSGIVVVARTSVAHAALQREMSAPDCRKDYLAVVHGHVREDVEIDLRLRVDERDRRRVAVSTEGGAPCVTRVTPMANTSLYGCVVSLVACRLLTGRRHQIRAHLAARGWPVVRDAVYGDVRLDRALEGSNAALCVPARQALHAWRLEVRHPVTGARLNVASPVPADLQPLVRAFGIHAIAFAS